MMLHQHRQELFRFQCDDLLYRVLRFHDCEIAFTVTGDPMRLGLFTKEDLRWSWDWVTDLPAVQETSQLVPVGQHAITVLRTSARHLAQYLAKCRPPFVYYQVTDEQRRHRLYRTLMQRYGIEQHYELLADDSQRYVMLSLKSSNTAQR